MLFLKFIKSFAMIFIIANVFFIDYTMYNQPQRVVTVKNPAKQDMYTDRHAVEQLQKQTNTIQTKLGDIETSLSVSPVQVNSYMQTPSNTVKEFFIPFGSGNSQSTTWTVVPGLQSYINTSLYPHIKTVTFEVGGHTPTGNQIVEVQLYNVTNNHIVWNSTISWTGGGSQYVISNPITLDSGNTLYEVQMQTQVGSLSFIDQAKVHIVLY